MALRACKECGQKISSDAKSCPHCGKKVGMGAGSSCLVVVGVLILLAVIPFVMKDHSGSREGGNTAVDTKQTALSQVKLDFKWSKGGFGSVMEADFVVKNDSDYSIKDFEVTCNHFAKSGTRIDSNTRTIYEVVKAHSTKKFPNFNMGFIHSQAASSSCGITDLSIAQ